MQLNPADLSGVIEILNRTYAEIHDIEVDYNLRFGHGDFRPRIDYFHDAVRALTDGDERHFAEGGRLTLELLAYDVATLRYLQSMPLARINANAAPRSPATSVQPTSKQPAGSENRPPRDTKLKLAELYQQYGVLFSALFKPYSDKDYEERIDALNDEVHTIASLVQRINGGGSEQELTDLIAHIHDPNLRAGLIELLRKRKKRELLALLDESSDYNDSLIDSLEEAHTQYVMSQLTLYEEGKDMVKKLAGEGMNLAGQFVESAIAEARRRMGKGGVGR